MCVAMLIPFSRRARSRCTCELLSRCMPVPVILNCNLRDRRASCCGGRVVERFCADFFNEQVIFVML